MHTPDEVPGTRSDWTLKLGSVHGVTVGVHASVVVTLAIVLPGLAEVSLPAMVDDYSRASYWGAALVGTVAFFAGLLLHELAHAVVAQTEGVEVSSVQLWMLGGAAGLSSEPPTPRAEARIAAAGPLASIGVASLAAAAAFVADAAGFDALATATMWWLFLLNALLALFNLLPFFPLDGGRLLTALLWRRSGDRAAAVARAARVGGHAGVVLMAVGVLQAVAGGLVAGLWWVLLGSFIRTLGRAEAADVTTRARLAALTIADLMTPDPLTVGPDLSVDDLVERLLRSRHVAFPVVDAEGELLGLVSLDEVRRTRRRHGRRVADIARPLDDVLVVEPGDPAWHVVGDLRAGVGDRVLVVSGDSLVGIVAPSDVGRVIDALGLGRPSAARQRSGYE